MDTVVREDRNAALAAPITGTLYEGKAGSIHDKSDPLVYLDGPEYRTVDEVESIAKQLAGKPFTLLHPNGLISKGAKADIAGYVVAGRVDSGYAVATIMVTSKSGIDAIKSGTYALSLGYSCVLDAERYQRNITIDHLALVPIPRCKTCFLRADTSGECTHAAEENTVKVEVGLTPELKQALDAMAKAMSDKLCPECSMPMADCPHGKMDADLTAKSRNALETEEFAVPGSRKLPINDESHVRAAMSRFNQTDFASDVERKTAYHKILAKAKALGIDTSGFQKAHGDSVDECTCKSRAMPHNNGEPMSDTKTDLAAEMEALKGKLEEAHKALTALEIEATNARKDADKAKADLEASVAEITAAKAEVEAAKAQVVSAKADADQAVASEIQARVDARVALFVEAGKVLKDTDLSKMSDRDIKCAVIKHVDGDEVASDKSMDYVTGVYEGALKRSLNAGASRDAARVAVVELRKDNAPLRGADAERAAKEKLARESAQAWTK